MSPPSATRAAAIIPIRPRGADRGRGGGDGITAHLREDRRHIRDEDLARIQAATNLPLNLEMAATDEMLAIALRHKPHAACIVPERREERTTEGGPMRRAAQPPRPHRGAPARCGHPRQPVHRPRAAADRGGDALGAPVVELHTGEYAHAEGEPRGGTARLTDMAALAAKNGIEPHAGHGLTYDNVQPIAAIPQIAELNIGHYLIGEAIFTGLDAAVRRMRALMDEARVVHDHRHRFGPVQHRAHRGGPVPPWRPFRARVFTETEQAHATAAPSPARARWPSGSPPRKPAPRRWAPALPRACS
jgi:pyridoxine 5-phosphate synthase